MRPDHRQLGREGPDRHADGLVLARRDHRVIDGVQYLVWAQKDYDIPGNSNLYIAPMANPWSWPLIR